VVSIAFANGEFNVSEFMSAARLCVDAQRRRCGFRRGYFNTAHY
jgi:hypothetical protein